MLLRCMINYPCIQEKKLELNNKEIEFKLNRNFFTVLILSLIFIVLEIAGFIYTWITYKWR